MKPKQRTSLAKRSFTIPMLVCVLSVVSVLAGCSGPPQLTAEDRRRDIQFLADWTRDYSPFAELNEKYKNTPSYEVLLPCYLEFAEQAETHEEFYQVVNGYFRVIGATGHFNLHDEEALKWGKIASLLGLVNLGITPGQFDRGRYWARLSAKASTRAHPPFHVKFRAGKYFADDNWEYEGTAIPKGSEILTVDGKTCSAYLDYVKTETLLKYDAYPKDWVDNWLMIIDEGPAFQGWQVEFGLPDGRVVSAFAPKVDGWPAPEEEPIRTEEPEANCTCLELTDEVGYVRIKSLAGQSVIESLFEGFVKRDRKRIEAFLRRSDGKYRKLIIDLRNNGGGLPRYGYDVLIRPFLDEPVTYSHVVGVKTKFLVDTDQHLLNYFRRYVSTKKEHVISTEEVQSPEGFDPNEWTFYEVTRTIEPHHRYDFNGELYFLTNGGSFSATDDTLGAVRRIGMATLVGRNTGGGSAGYFAPSFIVLPASSMVFRVETDLAINPDGRVNELFGMPPDIELPEADPPRSITKEGLLEDEWIKRVMSALPRGTQGDSD